MNKLMKKLSVVTTLLFGLSLSAQAAAEELWVAPSDKSDKEVGNWAVTNNGEVNFVFAAPDNLDSLGNVILVVLGKKTTTVDMEVEVSIAADGQAHDSNTSALALSGIDLIKDEVTEIDLSGAFPALAAGTDYVGVELETEEEGDVRVLGLRVQYRAVDPLAGLSCPEDEVLIGFNDDGSLKCKLFTGTGGGGGGSDPGGPGGITIAISDASETEGNVNNADMIFTISLNQQSTSTVTVNYATQDASAIAGEDYVATSGIAGFAPGQTSQTISVPVLDDTLDEGIETLNVVLSAPTNATIADGVGEGVIVDNDGGNGR